MELLFNNKFYRVNISFWTALRYRAEYGESVYDIIKDPDSHSYKRKLIALLHTSIEGDRPGLVELLAVADESNHLAAFAEKMYVELTKNDKLYEKQIKRLNKTGKTDEPNDEYDEFMIMEIYSKTQLPHSALQAATISQVIGMLLRLSDPADSIEYKKMTSADISAFYGKRKADA